MSRLSRFLFPALPGRRISFGLVVVRATFGSALALHGLDKLREPFKWMGEETWAPHFLQFLAAVSECVGGLALVIGVLTPLAALGVAMTMATGAVSAHILPGDPFVRAHAPELGEAQPLLGLPEWLVVRGGEGGSGEHAIVYCALALLFVLAGPGRYALDALISKKTPP